MFVLNYQDVSFSFFADFLLNLNSFINISRENLPILPDCLSNYYCSPDWENKMLIIIENHALNLHLMIPKFNAYEAGRRLVLNSAS